MKIQLGFSLIEFMISMMISAILMTVALSIYNQISKTTTTAQRISSLDTTAIILKKKLSQDLQALCPLWFTPELYEKLADSKKTTKGTKGETLISSQTINSENKRNNFFYAQIINDTFDFLTFISTNSLYSYGDKAKHCIRVVYKLQQDPHRDGFYQMLRKEEDTITSDFNIKTIKDGKFYKIADHINQCSIEYGFIDKSQKEEQLPEKNLTLKWVNKWGMTKELKEKDEYSPPLPDVIRLTLKLQQAHNQPTFNYELYCLIPISKNIILKSFAEQRYNQQRNTVQTNTNKTTHQ